MFIFEINKLIVKIPYYIFKENLHNFLYKKCEKILKDYQIFITNSDSYTPNDSDFELYNMIKNNK